MQQKPRFDFVCDTSTKFVLKNNICKFPIHAESIAVKNNWVIKSAPTVASMLGVSYPEFSSAVMNGADAKTWKMGDQYMIVFERHNKPYQRVNFSIAHDIGHILLGHFEDSLMSKYHKEIEATSKSIDMYNNWCAHGTMSQFDEVLYQLFANNVLKNNHTNVLEGSKSLKL